MLRFIELSIPSYSLLTAIGIIVAVYFLYCRNEAFGIKFKQLFIYTLIILAFMAIGSRVVFVISQIPSAIAMQSWHKILHSILGGGFVFYGGLYGAVLAVFLIEKNRKIEKNHLMNYFIPAFPVFHFFGRIGCFLAGCCYGIPSSFGVVLAEVDTLTRLPVQLFESGYNLIMVIVLLIIENRCKRQGKRYNMLFCYLAMYAPFRFVIEFFRGDALRGAFGPLSTSQWISLITVITLATIIIIKVVKEKKKSEKVSA